MKQMSQLKKFLVHPKFKIVFLVSFLTIIICSATLGGIYAYLTGDSIIRFEQNLNDIDPPDMGVNDFTAY